MLLGSLFFFFFSFPLFFKCATYALRKTCDVVSILETGMVMKRAYNAANTTETVDTDLDNHDCGLLEAEAVSSCIKG